MDVTDERKKRVSGPTDALGFADRRSGRDRRTEQGAPTDELAARRRHRDRRESPAGHIRNVLQVLAAVEHLETPDGDKLSVDGISRALWLALVELERREARAS